MANKVETRTSKVLCENCDSILEGDILMMEEAVNKLGCCHVGGVVVGPFFAWLKEKIMVAIAQELRTRRLVDRN